MPAWAKEPLLGFPEKELRRIEEQLERDLRAFGQPSGAVPGLQDARPGRCACGPLV